MPTRHPANASGDWYVDTRCINCGAAPDVAPGLIVERDGQSVFARQPASREEIVMAQRARLLCPTASVRAESHVAPAEDVFPQTLTRDVFRLGYNAKASYGAHSFLIHRSRGNVMVDSPRWAGAVVADLKRRGGLADILLTHRDDVADAGRYAAEFGARVWIHEADRDAAPYATNLIRGTEPVALDEGLLAIPVPGHTAGSVVYLYDDRCLFTGDSLAWDAERRDLTAYRDYCWHSWPEQTRSLRRLLDRRFEWVFAGHGGSAGLPAAQMHDRLAALVERMAAPAGSGVG